MRALLLVSTLGPAEARILDNAHRYGHEVDVLNVLQPGWVRRSAPQNRRELNRWATYWPLRTVRNQVTRLLRDVVKRGEYDAFFASSLPAAGFAARYLEEEFVPLLWRGDLDFSPAKAELTEDFHDLTVAIDRIFLQDEYEFDKALSKFSRSAHLLHLDEMIEHDLVRPSGTVITPFHSTPRVVLLHPERVDDARLDAQAHMLDGVAESQGGTLNTLSVSSLYRSKDLVRRRRFSSIAATRLDDFTHVVLTGTSRDHQAVADMLLEWGVSSRFVVEETIGMGYWARSRGFEQTGRGGRLGGLLHDMLCRTQPSDDGRSISSSEWVGSTADGAQPTDADVLSSYVTAMRTPLGRDYEEVAALMSTGPLDVFFSTSPLDDRTNGARPQRVRNMAEAMDASGASVRLYSTPQVFERRARLVRRLLESGRPAGMLYGENSTSPIPFESTVDGLVQLIEDVRRYGGGSAWFVRDLHWLDEFEGYLDDPERSTAFREAGLHELNAIGAAVDLVAAPSEASGEGFNDLLRRHGEPSRRWYPLPPAAAPQNMTDGLVDTASETDGPVTMLYAGGVSSIYGLDAYLGALQGFPEEVHMDFVVRPDEAELLRELLRRRQLDDRPRLRILTESLEWFVPQTRRCIGAILLGGEYARFSFPYKTVSMIERGYPILCYDDMAIADFVRGLEIGTTCARTAESIREGLNRLTANECPGIAEAQRTQTWKARFDSLRQHVAAEAGASG